MNAKRLVYSAALGLCVLTTCGDSCLPSNQGSGGFPVTTYTDLVDADGNLIAVSPSPGQSVSGTWLNDASGAGGNVYSFAGLTNINGQYYVAGGRVPATWSLQIIWEPACVEVTGGSVVETIDSSGFGWECIVTVTTEGGNSSSHFVLSGELPSTLTSYGDFSTSFGEPQLNVFAGGSVPGLVKTVSASAVVPGASATFPFPTQENGSPLTQGFYALVNTNIIPLTKNTLHSRWAQQILPFTTRFPRGFVLCPNHGSAFVFTLPIAGKFSATKVFRIFSPVSDFPGFIRGQKSYD